MKRKRLSIGLVPTLLLVTALTLGTAWATDGNLPGGTSISVEITAPPDGTLVAHPPGDVALAGAASIGEGLPLPNTLIVYVLDVSFSTIFAGPVGCGGDQNGDGNVDTILDCEIAAAKALNSLAAGLGTVGEVGVAVYGGHNVGNPADTGGAAADVGPGAGDQLVTGPDTDANANLTWDVDEVLNSAFSKFDRTGGVQVFTVKNVGSDGTNFAAGLAAAVSIVNSSAKPNKMIVFMSDGLANTGAPVSSVSVPAGVAIHTFAVGAAADCDNPGGGQGSLRAIANLAEPDGTCEKVETIANLPNVVPGIIASELFGLDLSVDGGAAIDLSGATVPPLPQTGPASVTFDYSEAGMVPGIHEFCATATGSDAGGVGDVTDCLDVTVADIDLVPPTATNELGYPGQTHTVTGVVAAGADGGVAGVEVNFAILSGPNAGLAGMATTDGSGDAEFTYMAMQGLAGLGTDVIEGCFVDDLGIEACDTAEKLWQDTTPPEVGCEETTNPSGKNVPKSKNEDGFYMLTATDLVDPDPQIYVMDSGSGTVFGPFASGTQIKYTEAPGAPPKMQKMGSSNGKAGAIDWHIIGNGDACVYAVDASGNQAECVECLVPPPPK
jgi:hypothetical protein